MLKATGESQQAIVSYKQAISTLQRIRSDIIAANKDLQFDVRDSVEPVYRELIGLLLDNNYTKSLNSNNNLSEALNVLELLKLTELQNFFGDECVQVASNDSKNRANLIVDPTAAVIYSVVLKNQTLMILRFPDGSLKSYPVTIESERLQEEINRLRFTLENIATEEYLT